MRFHNLGDDRLHPPLIATVYPVAALDSFRYLDKASGSNSFPLAFGR